MGKCANCEATLDPSWKFCIACGEAVEPTDEDAATPEPHVHAESRMQAESSAEAEPIPIPIPIPIPSAIRPDLLTDDGPLPRKRVDMALLLGIVMAVGGGVLIIIVAIALFSPRG